MTAIRIERVGALRVELHQDDDGQASNPRDWSNVGTLSGSSHYSTIFDEDRSQDAGTAYREARECYGPILAIPVRVTDGYLGNDLTPGCDWDDAHGIYYMPLRDLAKHGWPGTFAEQVKAARACMLAELETLQAWMHGEVYGYVVTTPDGDTVDSCWGFVGEDDYAMTEAMAAAQHAWNGMSELVRQTMALHDEDDE